jgi:hypothetical protein
MKGRIWWKYILIYENGKVRPIETIARMGGRRGMKKNGSEGEFNYGIL